MQIITVQITHQYPFEAVLCQGCQTAQDLETIIHACQACGRDICPHCGQSGKLCPDCRAELDQEASRRQDELAEHLWETGLALSKLGGVK